MEELLVHRETYLGWRVSVFQDQYCDSPRDDAVTFGYVVVVGNRRNGLYVKRTTYNDDRTFSCLEEFHGEHCVPPQCTDPWHAHSLEEFDTDSENLLPDRCPNKACCAWFSEGTEIRLDRLDPADWPDTPLLPDVVAVWSLHTGQDGAVYPAEKGTWDEGTEGFLVVREKDVENWALPQDYVDPERRQYCVDGAKAAALAALEAWSQWRQGNCWRWEIKPPTGRTDLEEDQCAGYVGDPWDRDCPFGGAVGQAKEAVDAAVALCRQQLDGVQQSLFADSKE